MRQEAKHFYEFGPFRLDAPERQLLRDGKPVELTPKAFDTLVALVENSGHLLTKDDLLKKVWPDSFVEEATLAKNVFMLRKALGSLSGEAEYIETVPTRGYRFVGQVREVTNGLPNLLPGEASTSPSFAPVAREPSARESRGRPWHRAIPALALGASLLVIGVLARQRFWPQPNPPARRIMLAVLPFSNLSGDATQEYFADGFSEEMITQLGNLEPARLGVIARTSAMQFKNTQKLVDQIGRELGVDYLLEGSVRHAGDRVRISAQLIRVRDQTHLWAADYDRDDRDILALQSDVAKAIAGEINLKLLPGAQAHGLASRPVDPEAHRLYLQGRFFWNKRTEKAYLEAIDHFLRAIQIDPGYPEPYAGLADTYALLGSLGGASISRRDAMNNVRSNARKALELDPAMAEAHTSLAFVLMHYDWDFAAAEREFLRAIDLNPNYGTAHQWHAINLAATGRVEAALAELRRAQELDPLSLIISADIGELLGGARRYQEATAQLQSTLQMDPNFLPAQLDLATVFNYQQKYAAAADHARKALELAPGSLWAESVLGAAYALNGQRDEAQKVMKTIQHSSHKDEGAVYLAVIATCLGDKDAAFRWLHVARDQRVGSLIVMKITPYWDPLRSDPRFASLLHDVGLDSTGNSD
jgi:TolB-like protein/DNA-binding winged helix-turn-helix (wHTH) protein/Tfp pilus assembly protein PilF